MTPGSDDTAGADAPEAPAEKQTHKISIVYRDAEPPVTTWRGKQFIKDVPQEFDEANEADFALIEAARGNPSFDVGGENKAEMRAQEQRALEVTTAQAELAGIDAEGSAIEQRQTAETNALEAQHSAEREAFLNGKEQRAMTLRRIIRGSDGSDDQHPVDDTSSANAPQADVIGADGRAQSGATPPLTPPPSQTNLPAPPPAPGQGQPTDPAAPAPAANQSAEPVRQADPNAALQSNNQV